MTFSFLRGQVETSIRVQYFDESFSFVYSKSLISNRLSPEFIYLNFITKYADTGKKGKALWQKKFLAQN